MGPPVLETEWFGTFLYEEDTLVAKRLFPPDASQIADRLTKIQDGDVLYEEDELADETDQLIVPDARLANLPGATHEPVPPRRQDPHEHDRDPKLLHQAATQLAEDTVRGSLSQKSRHLEQAVAYLDEAHEMENLMGERLVAWFRLSSPHVVDRAKDHLELARWILEHGSGDEITQAQGWDASTLGSPLSEQERDAIEGLATSLVEQAESREPLETFIDETANEIAPNVTTLTSPAIAARLIHHAGGLRKLAMQPASTIQMLGAENAVFQHLTEDAPPPKHGVIFQHPLIHQAHPNDRGSIARAMAAKIAIAARADALTGNDIAGELKAELEARAEEVSRVGRRRAMKNKGGSS